MTFYIESTAAETGDLFAESIIHHNFTVQPRSRDDSGRFEKHGPCIGADDVFERLILRLWVVAHQGSKSCGLLVVEACSHHLQLYLERVGSIGTRIAL